MSDIQETTPEEVLQALQALPNPEDLTSEQNALVEFLYVHALGWLKSNPRFDGASQDMYEANALVLVSWWIRDHGLSWPDGKKA